MSGASDAAIFLQSLHDPEIIERVRCTIQNAHVFKLPPRQSASVGWRGADWKEKVWQGTVKIVERGDLTAVLLVDRTKGSIFAVCPVKEGAVDRCVDSSRYFVLRIENANGRHMFIGVAFNERNDAFDFNISLQDARREKEQEKNPVKLDFGPPKDYSIKEGEKIKVSIPKTGGKFTLFKYNCIILFINLTINNSRIFVSKEQLQIGRKIIFKAVDT